MEQPRGHRQISVKGNNRRKPFTSRERCLCARRPQPALSHRMRPGQLQPAPARQRSNILRIPAGPSQRSVVARVPAGSVSAQSLGVSPTAPKRENSASSSGVGVSPKGPKWDSGVRSPKWDSGVGIRLRSIWLPGDLCQMLPPGLGSWGHDGAGATKVVSKEAAASARRQQQQFKTAPMGAGG